MKLILVPNSLPTNGLEPNCTIEYFKLLEYSFRAIAEKAHFYSEDILEWGVGKNKQEDREAVE